jgi:tight adherence protein C
MALLIALVIFAALMAAISYVGYRYYARPGRLYEQLGGRAIFTMPAIDRLTSEEEPGLLVSVLQQIGQMVPVNPDDASVIRRDLMAAGYRSDSAVAIYVGIRAVMAVVLVLLALLFRTSITSNSILGMVIPVAAGFLGYFGPSFVLDYLISSRQERIRFGLPDALDLMVVCVEAGLGLDQAMQYVATELVKAHPDVCQEMELANLEIRGGKRRTEALHNLAERTGEPELRKLVAVLVQTDRFGTSIADSLRTHSEFMRVRRRQEAEERAAKVGVKLVFPIFFCILPSMLIVVAGPGVLQLVKYLFPLMRGFHN